MVPVQAGDVLAGKYRVERVLGRGGMGVVVAAMHLQLGQRVALKFLLPQATETADAIERFLREARAAVQIRGEHVARVSDVGTLDSGAPFMVMEYLDGSDLSGLLQQRGPLPVGEAVDYVLQACEALAEAHALGIVHRDLKPANLFLTLRPDGSPLVKVLDFGISKVLGSSTSSGSAGQITATTAVMGSPLYMSPEQITSSRDVDLRTDIWSLGIILHELVTGRPPYHADTAPALMVAIAVAPPAPLRTHRPDAPAELEDIILRCLAKHRDQRFAHVAELAWALAPLSATSGAAAAQRIGRMLGVGAEPMPFTSTTAASFDSRAQAVLRGDTIGAWGGTGNGVAGHGRRNWILVAVGVALLLTAGGMALLLFRGEPSAPAAAAPLVPPAPQAPEVAAKNTQPAPQVLPMPPPSEPEARPDAGADREIAAPRTAPAASSAKGKPRAASTPGATRPPGARPKDLFNDME